MFIEKKAYWTAESYPKKASTAFTVGMLVAWDGAGAVRPAIATDAPGEIVGVVKEGVASTDATNDLILISVPESGRAKMECDVVAGTLSAAKVGLLYDLTDADTVNSGASVVDVVRCVGFISATRGIFELNK